MGLLFLYVKMAYTDIRGTAILRARNKAGKGRYSTGAPNSLIFIVGLGTVSQLLLGSTQL